MQCEFGCSIIESKEESWIGYIEVELMIQKYSYQISIRSYE